MKDSFARKVDKGSPLKTSNARVLKPKTKTLQFFDNARGCFCPRSLLGLLDVTKGKTKK